MHYKTNRFVLISFCLLTLLLATILQLPAFCHEFSGRVVGVSDGDTITVLANGLPKKIRLSGIDCPEKSQEFGQRAKLFTAEHSFGKEVTVLSSGHDKYGRTIGEVILPDGRNLNDMLLQAGYAWWYQRYSKDEHRHELEENARQMKLGLWNDPYPRAPWEYRKAH